MASRCAKFGIGKIGVLRVPKTLSGFVERRIGQVGAMIALICFALGRVGIAVQVEEQARGGECGAPTSTDRLAVQGEGSSPTYQQRPLVPRPDVSMVSVDPEGCYDCPT